MLLLLLPPPPLTHRKVHALAVQPDMLRSHGHGHQLPAQRRRRTAAATARVGALALQRVVDHLRQQCSSPC
jgi:hypothetical protein